MVTNGFWKTRQLQMGIALPAALAIAATVAVGAACGAGAEPQPVVFQPGIGASQGHFAGASLTPDGRTVFFTQYSDFTVDAKKTILVARTLAGGWSEPERASFSGDWSDTTPSVSPDGSRLYFASNRPVDGVAKKDFDIWFVDFRNGTAGTPKRVEGVHSAANETSPSVTARGALYFCSWREEGGRGLGDIWRAAPSGSGFQPPVNLGGPVNGPTGEWGVAVSADERVIVIESSGRVDGLSEAGDLYVSRRDSGKWSVPRRLSPPINSTFSELAPRFSPDGQDLYFASNRRGRLEMWKVRFSVADALRFAAGGQP